MSEIEQDLRRALRRKQPPTGFEGRVVARATFSKHSYRLRWRWIPAAVAACLLIGAAGAYWHRRTQAERAQQQLVEALQITAQKVALVERVAAENLIK